MADTFFNRRTDVFGGAFAADSAYISFPSVQGLNDEFTADFGLLIQQLQTTYQQQVTRLYEVGRPAVYYVGGRTQGSIAVQRVVGPRTITEAFYKKFGDVCQALTNTLQFTVQTGCNSGPNNDTEYNRLEGWADYTASFCVITSIGLGIRAQDMLINESLQLMFSSFKYTTGGN